MPKLTRVLVSGAMLAVLGSATAVVAQEQPNGRDQAVQQFRAAERASMDQPAPEQAVQRFRAGERGSLDRSVQVPATGPARPAEPGTPVALLAALGAAAVLALSLDALSVRRKARRTTAGAVV